MKYLVLAVAALAPCLAVDAQAQIASSRSGSTDIYTYDTETVTRIIANFGRCFAQRNPRASLDFIATAPSSRAEFQIYQRMAQQGMSCLAPGTTLRATPTFIRGAVAEGMLTIGAVVPPTHRQPVPARGEVRNVSDAARCYAAGNRAEVRALLTTRAGSRAEADRITQIVPGLRACLPPGVNVQFDGTLLRFRLAEAMLRMEPSTPNGAAGAN